MPAIAFTWDPTRHGKGSPFSVNLKTGCRCIYQGLGPGRAHHRAHAFNLKFVQDLLRVVRFHAAGDQGVAHFREQDGRRRLEGGPQRSRGIPARKVGQG